MLRRPPRSTRTDTLFPYTTLFRSVVAIAGAPDRDVEIHLVVDHIGLRLAQVPRHAGRAQHRAGKAPGNRVLRSEEHTSELQSLMRISYAVFCLKKKKRPETPEPYETCANLKGRRSGHLHRCN